MRLKLYAASCDTSYINQLANCSATKTLNNLMQVNAYAHASMSQHSAFIYMVETDDSCIIIL